MERKGIVNGVNQAGKASPPEQRSQTPARKPKKSLLDGIMSVLSAFAYIVSPIKGDKKK